MKKRIITARQEIDEIIAKCQVCHIAMVDPDHKPYVLPFNFGYQDGVIYLHSAQTGKKIDILKKCPDVCIAFSTDYVLRWQHEEVACSYGMKYRSVLCYGKVEFIEDPEQKVIVLNVVMRQYTGRDFPYNPPAIQEVNCWKVVVERFEGKAYGQ
ncbi:MAG: pyridoxamine 5'-phosphate oxidase family protein [Bacteroidetes bacterium]|nr:pyridoxamine 5'-phosphate oxidase family protein [Bacteroidota bacterium]